MSILSNIAGFLPAGVQVPARYWKRRISRELEPEIQWMVANAPRGRLVVDIGANMGNYTYAALRAGSSVIAFEPFPTCAAYLSAYAVRHPQLIFHQIALGDSHGESTLTVPLRNGRPSFGRGSLQRQHSDERDVIEVKVAVSTLDSFDLPTLGLVKIDVEGYELAVLRGAHDTITRDRPILMTELNPDWLGVSRDEAFRTIAALGYDGSFLDKNGHERSIDGRAQTIPVGALFLWRPH
ncbi:MAG: FkbM family methyltransferase [Ignavibacteriae bacterium]|nr:FkbM family methyltransferase [Ignavibacteriota bacterium]